jgi:HD-GYP domain-containing protein (c-di-GMP phosphodiesterase class II)
MRVALTARSLILATTTAGLVVVVAAATQAADVSLATAALLAAAVVLTELFQVPNDESSGDPDDAHHFSFSSAVHLAAVAIAGPWVAALVAAFGVVTVDKLRGSPSVRVLFNASVFALAVAAGGLAFQVAGGFPGTLEFPGDLAAIAALTVTYSLVNSVLVSAVVAVTSNRSPWMAIRDGVRAELPPRAAEAGLGIAAAFCALTQPWAVVPLLPLGYAVYQAHARLVLLRRETNRALETFANVVDERDSSTFRHSARVSEHVRSLAEWIGLKPGDVARLSWAGRLHDLGKIAVDSAVLRKPAALNDEEWRAMRRHPRLSARLLRRFRFAAGPAQAVEYHHERFDGSGYYGIGGDNPLTVAAHFIVVADAYDAMTSERPYRNRLSDEDALAEIERSSGTHFHPLVAKAFVAQRRGLDPLPALTFEERDRLRRLSLAPRRRWLGPILEHFRTTPASISLAGILAALAATGFDHPEVAAIGGVLAVCGFVRHTVVRRRARVLATRLRSVLEPGLTREQALDRVSSALAGAGGLTWAGLVDWSPETLAGILVSEWGSQAARPGESSLVSWLVREADVEPALLVTRGSELGREGTFVALPLEGGLPEPYAVFGFPDRVAPHVQAALREGLDAFPSQRPALALHPQPMAAAS